MPLQTNSTLQRVQAATAGEEYSGPPAPGDELWTGEAGAYLRERRARQTAGDLSNIVLDRVLIVDLDLDIDWQPGVFVTFQQTDAPAPETGRVDLVERRTIDDAEIPRDVRTVRLTLQAE